MTWIVVLAANTIGLALGYVVGYRRGYVVATLDACNTMLDKQIDIIKRSKS